MTKLPPTMRTLKGMLEVKVEEDQPAYVRFLILIRRKYLAENINK